MGGEESVLCSTGKPGGFEDPTCSCAPRNPNRPGRMQVAGVDSLDKDRINPWTKNIDPDDLETNCGMACAGPAVGSTTAPAGYLADTQDGGAIVMDSRAGPLWMDDDKETRRYDLDPEETSWRESNINGRGAATMRTSVAEAKLTQGGKSFKEKTGPSQQPAKGDVVAGKSSLAARASSARGGSTMPSQAGVSLVVEALPSKQCSTSTTGR